jgi:predicted transcriptional regulator
MAARLNVNVNDETAQALREIADRRDLSVTEVVRRAVSVYKFVEDEVFENGKTLQLIDPEKETVTSVALVG